MNIIVADDDRVFSKLVCGILNESGHVTLPAFDSIQAMLYISRQPPDLVVLDVNMPGGTGVEVLRKIKASSKTSFVPVIVLTGSMDPTLREKSLALGASDFITKPIDPEHLIKAVREAVK